MPQQQKEQEEEQRRQQRRISLVAGGVLIVVALLVGGSVYGVMERHSKALLSQSLQMALENRVQLIETEIWSGVDRTMVIPTRPLVLDLIQRINAGVDVNAVKAPVNAVAQSFIQTGFTAVALSDKNGRELAQLGHFSRSAALAVPLHTPQWPARVQLLWDEQLLLHVTGELKEAGQVVGSVRAEIPLPATMRLFNRAKSLGETGELALCASQGVSMQCFPTTLSATVLTLAKRSSQGVPLSMTHALEGETGFANALDYRGQWVAAAYSPVGDLGLGLVLKMDSAELYESVWTQLRYLIPLLVGVLAMALVLLRWLLTPLVAGLIRSQAKADEMSASLRDSERRGRALLDNVDEAILSISDSGVIELFNPAAEKMFGYRSAEVEGKNVSMLMPEPYCSAHDGYLARYLHTQEPQIIGAGREVMGRRSDGDVFPMDLRVSEFYPLNDLARLEGRRHFVGIIRDITEQKRAREEIEQLNASLEERVQRRTAQLEFANQQLEAFSYSVSHDLRSPLSAIDGFSNLLDKAMVKTVGDSPNDRSRHYLARIRAGVSQMGELIDALLALAQISRASLRSELVDLSALAEVLMVGFQERMPDRVVRLQIEPGLVAQGDPRLLRQVLDNLLSNAWKFSAAQACTEITFGHELSAEGETVYFVRDNGAGFEMAFADKLFGVFERLHTQLEFTGTGVGLATVQRIVVRHGGRVWAESSLGDGATFYFTLAQL